MHLPWIGKKCDRQRVKMPVDDRVGREQGSIDLEKTSGGEELPQALQKVRALLEYFTCCCWPKVTRSRHQTYSCHRSASDPSSGQEAIFTVAYSLTRSTYSPVRVSTLINSSMLMNAGHWISAPVSTLQGLVTLVAVFPFAPGSQYSTRKTT